MRKMLDNHLLNFIVLFQTMAKMYSAQMFYTESLSRKRGEQTHRYNDSYRKLSDWYSELPIEEFEILGLKKNMQTFDNLYRLTVVEGLPEEWMNTPIPDLGKFTVNL